MRKNCVSFVPKVAWALLGGVCGAMLVAPQGAEGRAAGAPALVGIEALQRVPWRAPQRCFGDSRAQQEAPEGER